MMTLDEALAHAATCTGESRTHEALRTLAAVHVKPEPPAEPVRLTHLLPPYGCCPACMSKTIDGICTRCGL